MYTTWIVPTSPTAAAWTRRTARSAGSEHPFALGEEDRSLWGEGDMPGVPPEQCDAQGGLERLDLLADRLLGDVQVVGRAREAAALRHGHEVAHLPQIRRHNRSILRRATAACGGPHACRAPPQSTDDQRPAGPTTSSCARTTNDAWSCRTHGVTLVAVRASCQAT